MPSGTPSPPPTAAARAGTQEPSPAAAWPPPQGTRGVGWVLAATLGWGTSSAVIAQLGGGAGAAAPVALGGAASLLIAAAILGLRPAQGLRSSRRLFLIAGALEAFNLTTYVAALQLGALPLVVSLHLSAPLLLLGAELLRRRGRLRPAVLGQLGLVLTAVLLVSQSLQEDPEPARALLGALLALASAVTVALLILLLARGSRGTHPVVAGGWQLLVAGVLTLPAGLLADPLPGSTLALLALNGAVLMGPAFALYWRGLSTVSPTVASIAGLSEAPIATAVAAVIFGAGFPLAMLAAGGCVLGAIALAGSPGEAGAPAPGDGRGAA